jgi:RimJ/RimL family protein N-acetyltransferase
VSDIVDYGFDQLGFEKLIFSNARRNVASCRIKENTGARFIGIEPAAFVDPQYTERELWELTKEMIRVFIFTNSNEQTSNLSAATPGRGHI